MNCGEIKELLSEGRVLTREAQDHLASCAGCRAMMEALVAPAAQPDPKHLSQIQERIAASLKPVRPLPSDRILAGALLVLFTAFSLLAAIPVGYYGFHVLSAYQRLAYYALIMVCAVSLSIIVVEQMIPGSKHKVNPRWTILAIPLSLALMVSVLFHDFDLYRFVARGVPCLRLGCICALTSGVLFWFILKKGFFTSPVMAGTTAGCFAGLAGVTVLALHCPIENAAHIIVWHLGAMVFGSIVGAVVGTSLLRF
jgi:hypothetical protein